MNGSEFDSVNSNSIESESDAGLLDNVGGDGAASIAAQEPNVDKDTEAEAAVTENEANESGFLWRCSFTITPTVAAAVLYLGELCFWSPCQPNPLIHAFADPRCQERWCRCC